MADVILSIAYEQGYQFLSAIVGEGVHESDTGYEDFYARYYTYDQLRGLEQDFEKAYSELDGVWMNTLNFADIRITLEKNSEKEMVLYSRGAIYMPDVFMPLFMERWQSYKDRCINKDTSAVITKYKEYSLDYIMMYKDMGNATSIKATYDNYLKIWRLTVWLSCDRYWFLSVFMKENGELDKYSLDYEGASDSHYEF